ncbi:flavin reductase (DIM6/NTAB) family NADH-FMN oxidoreductase RutF [Arthrobacter sp. 754]
MTNEALGAPFDTHELRQAFGTFATGVTVVTCR